MSNDGYNRNVVTMHERLICTLWSEEETIAIPFAQ